MLTLPSAVNGYIAKFGSALNRAMELSLPNKKGKNHEPQFVAFIVLCKGIKFYGYHVGHQPFLKIYTVNPRNQKRLSEILRSGAVLNTQFDVFEDHIPFLLQFMLDSNLYGCGWMDLGECKFREGVPGTRPSSSSVLYKASNESVAYRVRTGRF
jgi:DNA polymerase zeta